MIKISRAGLTVACLACLGCHKPAPLALAPVRGVVTFQGRPLAGGLIVFTPERGPKPFAARLDAYGHYELEPTPPAGPGLPSGVSRGIPPGRYDITFSDPPQPSDAQFPRKLRRPDTSGVAREVLAGQENVLDFHITAGGGGL